MGGFWDSMDHRSHQLLAIGCGLGIATMVLIDALELKIRDETFAYLRFAVDSMAVGLGWGVRGVLAAKGKQ